MMKIKGKNYGNALRVLKLRWSLFERTMHLGNMIMMMTTIRYKPCGRIEVSQVLKITQG